MAAENCDVEVGRDGSISLLKETCLPVLVALGDTASTTAEAEADRHNGIPGAKVSSFTQRDAENIEAHSGDIAVDQGVLGEGNYEDDSGPEPEKPFPAEPPAALPREALSEKISDGEGDMPYFGNVSESLTCGDIANMESVGNGTTEQQAQPDSVHNRDSSPGASPSNVDDEITSRAAIALAAIAVAANAQHSSPAAAAQAARAIAPGIVPGAGMSPRHNQDMKIVSLNAVKHFLKGKATATGAVQRLANGENDAFLQHLLLLECFRVHEDSRPDFPASPAAKGDESFQYEAEDSGVFDQELAVIAADRVRSMLSTISGAYNAMAGLLPCVPQPENDESEFDGIEAPPTIPDLLPPCTSTPGDATAEFFRECAGTAIRQEKVGNSLDGITEPDEKTPDDGTGATETGTSAEAGHATAASVFSSVFTSVKRSSIGSPGRSSLTSVFRKRSLRPGGGGKQDRDSLKGHDSRDDDLNDGEYAVVIEREMLGLTVENVLERTVVRTVLPGGAAKTAGAQVGSLIVKVGNVSTKNLTHFETIDELRQSQRPLRLVMRQLSGDALDDAREEMGRLIRGAGFGMITGRAMDETRQQSHQTPSSSVKRISPNPPQIKLYSRVLHERLTCDDEAKTKMNEAPVNKAGEKLIWILTLIAYGLEIEAGKVPPSLAEELHEETMHDKYRHHHHDVKDYADASKSVSKVLVDFMKKKVCPEKPETQQPAPTSMRTNTAMNRRGRRGAPPPPPPPVTRNQSVDLNKPLLHIGDVLHRTYTFLADPTSPPAALLRGEVVAFLCDVLDIDTGMELSEEENASSTAGGRAGPIGDLGSAGSLLKLIVLNCSMMRSPSCGIASSDRSEMNEELLNELRRRFGYRRKFSGVDEHRLHAGNRFLAVVHRLAASRSLSARVTACSLAPVLWGHLDFPHQLQLRGVITRALHDVDVIVRKSTAHVLHEIAELVFDSRSVPWLVLMCERAMTDPEPQLRSAAMTLTWHLAEHLPNAFLGDASQGSRSIRRLPPRTDPTFAEVYLLQCKLLPVATRLAEDRAPSVRLAVAAQCDRLCNALGEHWSSVIIDVLQALLGDSDERVRSEAILCVPRLVETVLVPASRDGPPDGGVGVLQALLPVSIKLQKDNCASVRVSLASAAGELLTLLVGLESLDEIFSPDCSSRSELSVGLEDVGRVRRYKTYVDETLIPLVQQLLHDADPEVTSSALRAVTNASRGTVREMRSRLNSASEAEDDTVSLSSFQSLPSVEKKEPVFIPVLSEAQVRRLLPTLTDLAGNRQWRVRQGAVEIVPALLSCTSKSETRVEIASLCIHLMSDRVDAVRRTAAECLCLGGGALGSHGKDLSGEWISNIVVPHIQSCGSSELSKQRQLSLTMIEVMLLNGVYPPRSTSPAIASEADLISTSPLHQLLEVAVSLSTDRVANVRLNVGRVIANTIHVFEETELIFLTNALKEQIEDEEKQPEGSDRDVLFYARLAMARAQARLLDESNSVSTADILL